MNHTPTPWVIANTGTDCPQISAPAKGHGYYSLIASVTQRDKHPLYGGEISTQEALANAEFVVRACNAHEDLVKIAKAYRNHLTACANTHGLVATYHHINDLLATIEKGA